MRHETIDLEEAHCFSSAFLDYIKGHNALTPFYHLPPTIDSFAAQIEQRQFPQERRNTLAAVLNEQYTDVEMHHTVQANIKALQSSTTFTVTTGHQLNIFTGPLYVIYKIVTAITCLLYTSPSPRDA